MTLGLAILFCALAAGTCHASADPDVTSFAVRVDGTAGTTVRLRAVGVPRGWIASFCAPHVCAPFHTSLRLKSAHETIQLSYVRSDLHAAPLGAPHVTVTR